MKYKITLAPSALDDIRDIVCYISEILANPEAAIRMLDSIEAAIISLSDSPKIHAFVSDERLFALGYRKLLIKNYIVFYIVNEQQRSVEIDRILYARRDWRHIL